MKTKEENTPQRGIECPRCGCRHFEVTNTEPMRGGRIRRRKLPHSEIPIATGSTIYRKRSRPTTRVKKV
jgi:hypothetical protein